MLEVMKSNNFDFTTRRVKLELLYMEKLRETVTSVTHLIKLTGESYNTALLNCNKLAKGNRKIKPAKLFFFFSEDMHLYFLTREYY